MLGGPSRLQLEKSRTNLVKFANAFLLPRSNTFLINGVSTNETTCTSICEPFLIQTYLQTFKDRPMHLMLVEDVVQRH
jgi:hypothetical protein